MKRTIFFSFLSFLLLVSCKQETYFNITTSVQPSNGGSIIITPPSGPVLEGTSVSFNANPKGDYIFTGWSGSISGTENPKTVTATSDLNVIANFELKTYPLNVSIEGEGVVNERVISTKTEYSSGTVVELTAKPSDYWLFDHWEDDLNGNTNPVQLTVSSPKSVKAVFVKKMYNLTVSIDGEGAVSETVKETRSGSYQEGTVVELTATPGTGWSFNRWEGDLSGEDNPVQITITGEKSVKAVFTKNKYAYNLKIVGPGVVDEYLLPETRADLDYGTRILLKAIPSEGAVFKGWSGDLSGSVSDMEIEIEEGMEITATFEPDFEKNKQPLVDLYLPSSMTKRLYYGLDFSTMSYYPTGFIAVDYNMDGFVDVITCEMGRESQDQRLPMNFYLGPDYEVDKENSGVHLAPICTRKSFTGDFNGDGKIDICFVGHGNEGFPDPKDYPVFLMSKENNTFSRKGIEDCFEYYHGSAAGDFDNDGDLDVVLLNNGNKGASCILVNDGNGNFTPRYDLLNYYWMEPAMYTIEFYDIDNDGFLDIVCGGNDYEGRNSFGRDYIAYDDSPFVLWGNGTSYADSPISRLGSNYIGFGDNSDFAFYDLDGNGTDEIIIAKSADGLDWDGALIHENGHGWMIQVFERNGRSFFDATEKYIIDEDPFHLDEVLNIWISMETVDNHVYLLSRKEGQTNAKRLYLLDNGKLVRVNEDEESGQPIKYTNGVCLYSDGVGSYGTHLDLAYSDNPYSGTTCIHFSNWPTWNGWSVDYEDWIDFSELEKQGYVLEFAIKNSDPEMLIAFSFETRLQTDPWYFPSYNYTYLASEHKCDGTWDLVQVPLSEMTCDSEWTGYYWNTIKTLIIMPWDYHGHDFYLDEIRIRRILDTQQP